jgi:hypothetical protein
VKPRLGPAELVDPLLVLLKAVKKLKPEQTDGRRRAARAASRLAIRKLLDSMDTSFPIAIKRKRKHFVTVDKKRTKLVEQGFVGRDLSALEVVKLKEAGVPVRVVKYPARPYPARPYLHVGKRREMWVKEWVLQLGVPFDSLSVGALKRLAEYPNERKLVLAEAALKKAPAYSP